MDNDSEIYSKIGIDNLSAPYIINKDVWSDFLCKKIREYGKYGCLCLLCLL